MKSSSAVFRALSIALLAAVVLYFGVQGCRYLTDPYSTTLAYRSSSEESISLTGWLVRDEEPAAWFLAQRYVGTDGVARTRRGVVASLGVDATEVLRLPISGLGLDLLAGGERLHALHQSSPSISLRTKMRDSLPRYQRKSGAFHQPTSLSVK